MTEAEWLASADPVVMLRFITENPDHANINCVRSDRKLRLFAVACCRSVFHLLTDDALCGQCMGAGTRPRTGSLLWPCDNCQGSGRVNRSRRAVEVAERFADGLATEEERREAESGAFQPWRTVDTPENCTAAAAHACICSPTDLERLLRQLPEHHATQTALLREIVGNPFRPVYVPWQCRECGIPCGPASAGTYCVKCGCDETICPWLTPTVTGLAQAAYEERWQCERCGMDEYNPGCHHDNGRNGTLDPDRLAILADALEEAGCSEVELLQHLRGWERCPECLGYGAIERLDAGYMRRFGLPDWDGCSDCGGEHFGGKQGTGWVPLRGPHVPHVRGCWAVDLLLGKS